MSRDDTLEVVLSKLSSGDMAAAEQVFLAYEPYLRKVVRRQLPIWLRAKFDSADIVQSVWADLIRGFRDAGWRFADVGHLRAFLVKLARNRFIDHVRHHRVETKHEQSLSEDAAAGLPSQQPRPSEIAQADELWEQMLHLCPPEHRNILRLKRQGLAMTEIVARTGLHEDSIRRILRKLSRQVAFLQQSASPASGPDL